MAAGIGLVPEDRRQQGLVMDFSIERNIALASLDSVRRAGLIPRGGERSFARDWAIRLQLKYGRLSDPVWTLSGGNQQKAVLAKWLARKPTLLIVDEPTRGIDVGTKAEVHRLLSELAAQGVAVLMISSELPEVLGMADRIVVLFEGRVTREFAGAAIIALLAIGETIVIVTRNVDLSIGSVLGISAYATGVLYVHHPHVSLVPVFLLALAIGVACGVVNGLVVTVARVPSLVVTLDTLYMIRGIDGAWAGGNQVNASMLPTGFNKIGYGTIAGIPYLGIIAIVAVAIATYWMRSFRTPRDLYAIGSDPDAAR